MLVLSRRAGESIVIDGDIQVQVVSIGGNKVRLGIVSPEHIVVDRAEIHRRRMEFELLEEGHRSSGTEMDYVI